jgi:hypothetical protein
VVTELYQDAFVGSSIENGTTIIQFDLRKRDWQGALGTTATICWRQEPYHVDIHELSTFHNPLSLLPRGGLRSQPQTHCTPLFRAVSDTDYQVIDQTLA